ncbi:hypothetical protein QE417_002223 [Mucilaginibacter terrae]|uniref:Uncharacterized protein n=1 Tax=Mucilaginibacter terrae TaxID=1955052 RepID=A0ABU3GUA2_9SPHI|nr:hypothetical protein [Mucilaginibacter terrae]
MKDEIIALMLQDRGNTGQFRGFQKMKSERSRDEQRRRAAGSESGKITKTQRAENKV